MIDCLFLEFMKEPGKRINLAVILLSNKLTTRLT